MDFRGPSALNLRQYVNYFDLYNLKLWSWYVYSLNGRALFDSWLYFLKGTECCLWSKNWGSVKLIGRSLTDGRWFLDWLITLSCDHNMFILSNGRALFDFRLQFLKGTGVAESVCNFFIAFLIDWLLWAVITIALFDFWLVISKEDWCCRVRTSKR